MSVKSALKPAYYRALASINLPLRRRLLYAAKHRRWPNLDVPQSFTEKMNWRIIHDRRPQLAWTCDKLRMKEIARQRSSKLIRIPETYWHGTDVTQLAGIELPDHWVLKPTHRSGALVLFGGGQANTDELVLKTHQWLDDVNWSALGEWAYSQAEPNLMIEELIGVPGTSPTDYKFFVFDGKPELILAVDDRFGQPVKRYYRPDWSLLGTKGEADNQLEPPQNLNKMLDAAATLGAGFDFMRVDLYDANGEVWFGELSPYSGSGLTPFVPKSLDDELGAVWRLPIQEITDAE